MNPCHRHGKKYRWSAVLTQQWPHLFLRGWRPLSLWSASKITDFPILHAMEYSRLEIHSTHLSSFIKANILPFLRSYSPDSYLPNLHSFLLVTWRSWQIRALPMRDYTFLRQCNTLVSRALSEQCGQWQTSMDRSPWSTFTHQCFQKNGKVCHIIREWQRYFGMLCRSWEEGKRWLRSIGWILFTMAPEWSYWLHEYVTHYILVKCISANCFAFPGHDALMNFNPSWTSDDIPAPRTSQSCYMAVLCLFCWILFYVFCKMIILVPMIYCLLQSPCLHECDRDSCPLI